MNRTITDIIPPSRRRALEAQGALEPRAELGTPEEAEFVAPPPSGPQRPPRPLSDKPYEPNDGRRRFPLGTAAIVVGIIVLCVAAMYWFSGAQVKVTPTANSAFVSGDFTAVSGSGDLPFEIITVEKTAGSAVAGESTETANDPAQGEITILNAQSEPQTLIKNTRFETPEGLIFRIQDSVSIPAGSPAAPGTLRATVYADAGGQQYNIGPTTFTVPGLSGSAAFELVTARSEAPMVGGFSGERASVSQMTRETQDTKNRAALETELRNGITAAVPEGYILVPGASFTSFTPAPDAVERDNTVTISTRGVTTAVVFPKEALAKAIAYRTVGTYAGQPITIPDASGLTLTPAGEGAPVGLDTFDFSLSGNTSVVWVADPARIAGAVAGKSRDAAETTLQGFPEVATATLVLRPFWSRSFPDDPADIEVVIEEPAR
jgi:hypothetical protein